MLFTCVTSYVYELMGRKWTIFLSFVSSAAIMVAFPYSSPDMGALLTLRCILGITMCAPMAHPLIPDYIKRNSRGKAIAVSGVGLVLGEVFSIGVLFNQTKTMTYYNAFLVAGAVVALLGIFLFLVIKDPNLKKIRGGGASKHSVYAEERRAMSQMDSRSFNRSRRSDPIGDRSLDFGTTSHQEMQMATKAEQSTLINASRKEQLPEIVETQTDQEVSQANDTASRAKEGEVDAKSIPDEFQFDNQPTNKKVGELNYMVWLEIKENPLLVVLMFGASITKLIGVLFSIYLLLWIQSFADIRARHGNQTQVITKQDGKTIYQNIMVISVLVSGFVFPFVGGICDRFSPKYVIPVSFVCRALTCAAFHFVEQPNGNHALFSCIAMIIATIVENISVDTIFAQNLSKETRAIFNGMYSFMG
jgi:MFS family permease